jgi:D-alanyl-lipoteichoic acid acyltransferase DltB (MBOAT superfamily)
MTFNSLFYFIFMPAVYVKYYSMEDRWRWLLLLIASYGFYASLRAPYLLVVLLMVTGISYICALRMASQHDDSIRKRWLWMGSFACVAILALLKYLPFFESQAVSILGLSLDVSSTVVSIGVSYFTFQAISYLADVYLEIEEAEHHFGYYALYLAFFPKLLQGPIERAGDLLPQLKSPCRFEYDTVRSGIVLFAWGLFKKVVVADLLALYANQAYNNINQYSRPALLLGTYAFALQIYFDFSGYTDMARGTGRIFGINLTENFNSPYLATSIADFWRRWHMSFSRWILDYIFKPLQLWWRGLGQAGTALALMVTFLVSGIWHGASWGFVIWGLLHGSYLAASTYYRPYQKRLHKRLGIGKSRWLKWWQIFVTFNLVSFAWIFFRAGGRNGWHVVRRLFSNVSPATDVSNLDAASVSNLIVSQGKYNAVLVVLLLVFFWYIGVFKKDYNLSGKNLFYRWCAYLTLVLSTCLLAQNGDGNFLYLKF